MNGGARAIFRADNEKILSIVTVPLYVNIKGIHELRDYLTIGPKNDFLISEIPIECQTSHKKMKMWSMVES